MKADNSDAGFRRQLNAATAKLEAAGKLPPRKLTWQMPGRWIKRTPGTVLVRVPLKLDGRPVDAAEAAITFADQPWATKARYCGTSAGFHLFERPAEGAK